MWAMLTQILSQARRLAGFLALLYAPAWIFLAAVVVASRQLEVPLNDFTRDPASIAGMHPFAGVASSLGVLLWTATAAICLFSSAVLRYRLGERRSALFLLCSGLVTGLLLFDDLFLTHEILAPVYLGASENSVMIAYVLIVYGWTMTFKREILRTEYLLLIVALAFFVASVVVDAWQHRVYSVIGHWHIIVEDGLKLLGIVGWLGYFARCSLEMIGARRPPAGATSPRTEVRG